MLQTYKPISVLAAAVLLAAGCTGNATEPAPDLSFTPESASLLSSGISATAAGGDYLVSFSSATDWHISVSGTRALVSWLVVTPPAGKAGSVEATVSVLPNDTFDGRSTQLSFISGDIVKSMNISQEPRSAIAATALVLNESSVSLLPGDTFALAATVFPSYSDSDKSVSWSSSDTRVATVSDGLVTAVGEGTAVISAAAGSLKAGCTVTVGHRAVNVESISLDPVSITLEAGSTAQLTAAMTPADADAVLVWDSSDPGVVTVSDGLITAIAPGTASVTVSAGGKSASCEVTVTVSGSGGEDLDDNITVNPWSI